MPQTKTITTYTYAELKEQGGTAKERARQWLVEGCFDHEWWDFCYEDAETLFPHMGWELDRKSVV